MAVGRLVTLVLEVADLAASEAFYRDGLGLALHAGADNQAGDDRWLSGAHAAISWTDGAFLHFSLYQAKAQVTCSAQVAFASDDLLSDHARLVAFGAEVIHSPRPEPWGDTARYLDPDGNVVSLTQS